MTAPISVLVVDDHRLVRSGLRRLLEEPDEFTVVAEAGTVADTRRLVAYHRPDVVVLDVVLPDGDGLQLCREILSGDQATACLLLTSFPERRALLSATLAGAAGYLSKEVDAGTLVEAVRTAADGGSLLDPGAVDELLDELREMPGGAASTG